MFRLERKGLEWIEKHLYLFVIAAVTIVAGFIRFSVRDFVSVDAERSLLLWYDIISLNGKLVRLKNQVGNYNLLYQFLIALMTYLPIKPLSAYKLLSCVFDYLLAVAAGCLAAYGESGGKRWKFLAAYAMVLLSPIVIANSATWAQCDSIYTFWLVLSVLFLIKGKYIRAFVFFGLALSFKLQAVFLLPFLLFAYFCLKKFSLLHFGIAPAVLWLSGVPAYLMGRDLGAAFAIYQAQSAERPRISYHYPSFWLLLLSEDDVNAHPEACYQYFLYGTAAMLVCVCILAAWMVWWVYRRVEWNEANLLYAAFLLNYTVVLFLPNMHERYGYVYEILAIVIALRNRKTVPLLLLLTGISLLTYGNYLYERPVDFYLLPFVNCGVYAAYGYMLNKKMLPGERFDLP